MIRQVQNNEENRDLDRRRKKMAIATSISMILVFLSIGILILVNNQEKIDITLKVNYSSRSRPIDLINDLHLNESAIADFNNETVTLFINESTSNKSVQIHYYINNTFLQVSNPNETLKIAHATTHHRYHFCFQYRLNSANPDIQKINIFGLQNSLNFSCEILSNHSNAITMDPQYEMFNNILENGRHDSRIWVVDPANRDAAPGHVFTVRAYWYVPEYWS